MGTLLRRAVGLVLFSFAAACGGSGGSDAGTDSGGACTADGTPCGTGMICRSATCVPSTCGDGLLDSRTEQCDDGNAIALDGCEPVTCEYTCALDSDCDDQDACSGAETCLPTHVCGTGTPAREWTACNTASITGGSCRSGTCMAARCSPTAPFGEPVALDALNSDFAEAYAFLSYDELTIYFSSDRPGGSGSYDIWTATRSGPDAAWGTPSPLEGVNTVVAEHEAAVTADGLTLYAIQTLADEWGIVSAERAAIDQPFGALTPVAAFGDGALYENPYPLPDHSAVYFSSHASGDWNVDRASRASGTLGPLLPVNAIDLNTSYTDLGTVVTPDELTIYIASDRPTGGGMADVWMARRTSTADPYGPAENLGLPVNTAANELPSWISADGCVLHLTRSTRIDDLYVATRGF